MAAGIWDFTIEQGSYFECELTCRDATGNLRDFTGCTARMKAKNVDGSLLFELTTENGGLEFGPGKIKVVIDAPATTALHFVSGRHDLEIIDALGKPKRYLKGTVTLDPETTD